MGSYFIDVVLPSTNMPEKGSYTVNEVAHMLGKHQLTVRAMIREGKMKGVNPKGTDLRIYKKDLMAFFAEYDD